MSANTILDPYGRLAIHTPQASVGGFGSGLFRQSKDSGFRKWRPTLNKDVSSLMPQWRQRALVSDARHVYTTSGGQVAGAVHAKATATVGDAWLPVYQGEDETFRKAFNALMPQWMERCVIGPSAMDFVVGAWLGSKSLDVDGDYFIVPTYAKDNSYPLIRYIEGHRVGSRMGQMEIPKGKYRGARIDSGIVVDRRGFPLAIQVLGETEKEDEYISLRQAIHVFDPKWYSQLRGIPSLAYGILDWYDLGEIRDAEKIAVKTHSKIALLHRTDTGRKPSYSDIADGQDIQNIGDGTAANVTEVMDGMIKYVQAKGDVTAFLGNRPGNGWQPMMEYIAHGAYEGMDWPGELAWKMAGSGANARAVIRRARGSVKWRQRILRRPNKRALMHGVTNFIKRGDLPFTRDWWNLGFTMPPEISIDDGNDRKADREDMRMGLEDRRTIIEKRHNISYEDWLKRAAHDEKLLLAAAEDAEIPTWRLSMLTPNGNEPVTVSGKKTQPKEDTP